MTYNQASALNAESHIKYWLCLLQFLKQRSTFWVEFTTDTFKMSNQPLLFRHFTSLLFFCGSRELHQPPFSLSMRHNKTTSALVRPHLQPIVCDGSFTCARKCISVHVDVQLLSLNCLNVEGKVGWCYPFQYCGNRWGKSLWGPLQTPFQISLPLLVSLEIQRENPFRKEIRLVRRKMAGSDYSNSLLSVMQI